MARGDDIEAAIRAFAIRALGWDPEGPDPPPRELLQCLARQHEREESRRKWRGTAILTLVSAAIAAAIGVAAKELATWVFRSGAS